MKQESRSTMYQRIRHQCDAKQAQLEIVTKTRNMDDIMPFIDMGHRLFAENQVIEAVDKWQNHPNIDDIRLHLIGRLQTNKINKALGLFDVIETLDRPDLAKKIADRIEHSHPSDIQTKAFFIQVNTGKESQKAGIMPDAFKDFLQFCRHDLHLNITGIMAIPPKDAPKHAHFAYMQSLKQKFNLSYVSMGMSSDYETALLLGATHIRLGRAMFEPPAMMDPIG